MVKYIAKSGANYLVSDHRLETREIPYAGIEVGTKLSKIGSKRRSSFEMKDGLYMRYDGQFTHDNYEYVVFRNKSMDEEIDKEWYCYVFNIISETKLLIFSKDVRAAADIVVDSFVDFKE